LPFGGYQDFAACVAANQDKADPKAYCGTIQAAAEKAAKDDAQKRFEIKKADDIGQMLFGWASIAVKADGTQLEDLDSELIDGPVLEKAAYEYVYDSGVTRDMHAGEPIGRLVEAVVVTDEKLAAMGLKRDGAPTVGFWTGYKIPDRETYLRVKATRKMLSIGGRCTRVEA